MKKLVLKFVVFSIIIMSLSCSKDEAPKQPDLPEISVVDISNESDWDYWVAGKDDYYYVKSSLSKNKPEKVVYHSSQANKDYSVFFNQEGLLDKVIVDKNIFVFKKFNGNKVDVGLILPNGEIEIYREVTTENFDWSVANAALKSSVENADFSSVVRWTGRIVAGVPCVVSVVATLNSGGALAPIAAWSCGNYLLSLSVDIATNEANIHNGFTNFVETYGNISTVYSCVGIEPLECVTGLASNSLSELADNLEELEIRNNDVQVTEAALNYGYGDVQVTLTWDNGADVDLHVIDPNGEEIYWRDQYAASGGILDVDDRNGYGPENIYWPANKAPDGTYKVYVHHYPSSPRTSNYTVLVNAFGRVKKYTGSLSYNEEIHVVDFSQNGFNKLNTKKSNNNITINKRKY